MALETSFLLNDLKSFLPEQTTSPAAGATKPSNGFQVALNKETQNQRPVENPVATAEKAGLDFPQNDFPAENTTTTPSLVLDSQEELPPTPSASQLDLGTTVPADTLEAKPQAANPLVEPEPLEVATNAPELPKEQIAAAAIEDPRLKLTRETAPHTTYIEASSPEAVGLIAEKETEEKAGPELLDTAPLQSAEKQTDDLAVNEAKTGQELNTAEEQSSPFGGEAQAFAAKDTTTTVAEDNAGLSAEQKISRAEAPKVNTQQNELPVSLTTKKLASILQLPQDNLEPIENLTNPAIGGKENPFTVIGVNSKAHQATQAKLSELATILPEDAKVTVKHPGEKAPSIQMPAMTTLALLEEKVSTPTTQKTHGLTNSMLARLINRGRKIGQNGPQSSNLDTELTNTKGNPSNQTPGITLTTENLEAGQSEVSLDVSPAHTGKLPKMEVEVAPNLGLATAAGNKEGFTAALKAETGTPLTQPQVPDNQVIDQIFTRLTGLGNKQETKMTLKLNPEELGDLKIDIAATEEGIKILFEAQTQQVQEVLERNSSRLQQALEQSGINLSEFQVDVDSRGSDQSQQQEKWAALQEKQDKSSDSDKQENPELNETAANTTTSSHDGLLDITA